MLAASWKGKRQQHVEEDALVQVGAGEMHREGGRKAGDGQQEDGRWCRAGGEHEMERRKGQWRAGQGKLRGRMEVKQKRF